MKKVGILVVLLTAVFVNAELAIVNGDFDLDVPEDGLLADVPDWYDSNPSEFWEGPFCADDGASHNDTATLILPTEDNEIYQGINGGGKNYCYQSIGTKAGETSLSLKFDWARADIHEGLADVGLTFTILESDGQFIPGDDTDIFDRAGVTVVDQKTFFEMSIPTKLTKYEIWTFDLTSAGGGELFLRINNCSTAPDAYDGWISLDNIEILSIVNDSPEDGADGIDSLLESASNDLVFTVLDSRIVAVDVILSPRDDVFFSNTTNEDYKIVKAMPVASGQQYTIDLEEELEENLSGFTRYYWQVVGYDSNSEQIIGPVTSFAVVSHFHPVYIVPENIVCEAGSSIEIRVLAMNISDYKWYKEGESVPLTDGDEYSGTQTDRLTINDLQITDEGNYYCVVSNLNGYETSSSCSVMIERQVNHYPMEAVDEGYTEDIVGGKDMALYSDGSLATLQNLLNEDVVDPMLGDTCLYLANTQEDPMRYYGNIPAGLMGYKEFTISAWVKVGHVDSNRYIWYFGEDTHYYVALAVNDDSKVCFSAKWSGEEQVAESDIDIVPDEWTHLAVTFTEGVGRLYIDGELHGKNYVEDMDLSYLELDNNYIGKSCFADDRYLNGKIDEFKIYNYDLSADEVAREYLTVKGGWVCDYERKDGRFDFNNDCIVDLLDFSIFAGAWLDDYRIY